MSMFHDPCSSQGLFRCGAGQEDLAVTEATKGKFCLLKAAVVLRGFRFL